MFSAFDPTDIQVGIEPDVFLGQTSFTADHLQSLHDLFYQNIITPLPFHSANYRNYEMNFYYTLVARS